MKQIIALMLMASVLCAAAPVWAEQPLTQEGKKTVFQRVVSHPGATLYRDASASGVVNSPRTFTAFYVYEKQGDMLRVGVSSTRSDGWLKSTEVTNWPHAITMVFTDRMGRQPVLFFKDHQAAENACTADSIKNTLGQYIQLFSTPNARIPADSPVIATEPLDKDGQISQKNFYLLPVLETDDQFKESGTQLLKVACINPGVPKTPEGSSAKKAANGSDGMRTGIVFVIDTTKSMKPYIDKTREVIRTVFNTLQQSPNKDKVAIAVVAFRSNVEKRPDTQYNTLIVSDFATVNERHTMEGLLDRLEECTASTHDFDEDSLAGVKEAVDALSWDKVDGKVMLLITDAGPLAGSDPTSKTGMSPEGMADYLRTNNIHLTTLHIKSPAGKNDHKYAEKSYRALSMLSNNRSSYFAIDAPTAEAGAKKFEEYSNTIAASYCKIVEHQAQQGTRALKIQNPAKDATSLDAAQQMAEAIGYSMQLQFAGNQKGTTAPQVVSAWIADTDLVSLEADPNAAPVPAVQPAVLLTKLQLSQLRKQVQTIISTAEETFLRGNENFNFYEQLISAAAGMTRDPSSFNSNPGANLAQQGVLLEVLDGLPYNSNILRMKQEDWLRMSTGDQQAFIKRLKGLVKRYEEYDRDNTHWESFGASNPNEAVYRVPLNMLP